MAVALCACTAPAGAVVGGTPVPEGQMRFVANIAVGGSFGCTGTLIAPTWVLTAGHCGSMTGSISGGVVPSPIGLPPSAYDVKLDSVHADGTGAEDHAVKQVVVDSDYIVINGTGNDVTLLELDSASRVPPMPIAAVGERALWAPGVLATIAGFGMTSQDAQQPPAQMQMARVPIQSDDACAKAYPNGLSSTDGSFDARSMLCAGYPQGGTDTCQGDSGGPLLAPAGRGAFRLVGATSFGAGCAQPGKPGVYARLAEGPIRTFITRFVPGAFAPEPKATAKAKPKAKKKLRHKRKHHHKRHAKHKRRHHKRAHR